MDQNISDNSATSSGFLKIPLALLARRDLGLSSKVIFSYLRFRAGGNGCAWPGVDRIARDVGVDKKTVLSAIRGLELAGLLSVERARNSGRTNRYKFSTGGEFGPVEFFHPDRWNFSTQTGGDSPLKKNNRKDSKKRAGAGDFDPLTMPLPVKLDCPEFSEAWRDWIADRAARRRPLSRRGAELQLARLAEWGPERAVLSISTSMERGWIGLFEPRPANAHRSEDPTRARGQPGKWNQKNAHKLS